MRLRELCDTIREIAANPQSAKPQELGHLADEYADYVGEANRRLSRCSEWLRRGLRTEAIHWAEQPPDLLEVTTVLGLGSDLSTWKELCQLNEATVAPDVNWTAATELNNAYDTERHLERLLRRHRRAALAHASSRERLKILRQLRDEDPDNPNWEEDLIALERARATDLNREAKLALDACDLSRLKKLEEELKSSNWTYRPSGRLVQEVERARWKAQEKVALERYRKLAGNIHAAMGAMNRKTIERLHTKWCAVEESMEVAPPSDLAEETRQVFDWLNEERNKEQQEAEFELSCHRLSEALDERSAATEIDRRVAEVQRYDRGLPTVLQQRVQNRMAEHQLERGRRFRLTIGGLAAVLVISASAIGWLIFERNQQSLLERWLGPISQAVEEEEWDRGRELYELVPAPLRSDPGFHDLKLRVDEAIEADFDRRQAFLAAMEAAEAAGVEEPNEDALRRAKELARAPSEKQRQQLVQDKVAAHAARMQHERDNGFRVTLGSIRERFDAVQASSDDAIQLEPLRDLQTDLAKVRTDLDALLESEAISAGLVTSARTLGDVISRLHLDVTERAARRQSMNKHIDVLGLPPRDLDSLIDELSSFVEKYPETPLTQHFREALRSGAAWRDARDWHSLTPESLFAGTRDGAVSRLEAVQSFGEHDRLWPPNDLVVTYTNYLGAAATAYEDKERPSQRLQPVLANPLMELSCVRLIDGARVYTHGGTLRSMTGGYSVTKVIRDARDFQASPGGYVIERERALPDPTIEPSGQMLWAGAIRETLGAIDTERWDIAYLSVIARLLAEPDMDEILRLHLAKQLLQEHGRLAWFEDPSISVWLTEAAAVDTQVAWLDPVHDPTADVRKSRTGARAMLKRIPSPASLRSELLSQWDSLAERLGPRDMGGIIWRDERGQQAIRQFVEARVYEVLTVGTDGAWVFIEVGTSTEDGIELLPSAQGVPYGTPIFVR